jgi:hypothetical protein
MLRPIGSPLPLGVLALAGATPLVSGLQLGWLDASQGKDVALILIAFVFPLQLVTSVFGYLGRDVVAGTGMGVLAGTWLSVGLITLTSPTGSTGSRGPRALRGGRLRGARARARGGSAPDHPAHRTARCRSRCRTRTGNSPAALKQRISWTLAQ